MPAHRENRDAGLTPNVGNQKHDTPDWPDHLDKTCVVGHNQNELEPETSGSATRSTISESVPGSGTRRGGTSTSGDIGYTTRFRSFSVSPSAPPALPPFPTPLLGRLGKRDLLLVNPLMGLHLEWYPPPLPLLLSPPDQLLPFGQPDPLHLEPGEGKLVLLLDPQLVGPPLKLKLVDFSGGTTETTSAVTFSSAVVKAAIYASSPCLCQCLCGVSISICNGGTNSISIWLNPRLYHWWFWNLSYGYGYG